MQKNHPAHKTMGGYMELEIPAGEEYYSNLLRLNTARNALEYVLKQKRYTKIYIPYFTCEVMLEPLQRLGTAYDFYNINDDLEPAIDFKLDAHTCLLYTNYFGIKQQAVERLSKRYKNIIIDNSQAFYAEPLTDVDTFYSCRKFFGVPDGAYLSISKKSTRKLPVDVSIDRFSHLIKSIDLGIEAGYSDFMANNDVLINNSIKTMSNLTRRLLSGINYSLCAQIRKRNFNFLHKNLKEFNLLKIDTTDSDVPMVYPFLHNNWQLKVNLIQKKIFVATYWPNVFKWTSNSMYENYLTRCIVPLPIDHRYTLQDMLYMLNLLKEML